MDPIRKAQLSDVSRIAEILIFAKRVRYRNIFHNDRVSFGEMQVLPLAQEYLSGEQSLDHIWVYNDEFVKGMVHTEAGQICELYVDPFFQGKGIGSALLQFAIQERNARWLWVLEKNSLAIQFYEAYGFVPTGERTPEAGTPEFIMKMVLKT